MVSGWIKLPVIALAALALVFGCGPRISSEPGTACFSIYRTGADGVRINGVTEVKANEEVGIDIVCAESCTHSREIDWGDGSRGDHMTHVYNDPGAYTVKYTCSTQSQKARAHARKRGRSSHSRRYASTKTITVTR